jgi:hypothetical protein
MKMDGNWFLGSGLYFSNISASFDQKDRDELVAYLNEAPHFAQENGEQKSLEVFSDINGSFTKDGHYILPVTTMDVVWPFLTSPR